MTVRELINLLSEQTLDANVNLSVPGSDASYDVIRVETVSSQHDDDARYNIVVVVEGAR